MKTNVTNEELRELDCEIECIVFGRTDCKATGDCFGSIEYDSDKMPPRMFTTDAAASDALDDAILKKLKGKFDGYKTWFTGINHIYQCVNGKRFAEHPDKKVCRALFAKQLFKPTTEGV